MGVESKFKNPLKSFRELCVKWKWMYKDFYLYQGKYCIPGKEEELDSIGTVICTLEPDYRELVKEFLPVETNRVLSLVPEKMKTAIDEEKEIPFSNIDDEKEMAVIGNIVEMNLAFFQEEGVIWKGLGEDQTMLVTIFDNKNIYPMICKVVEDEKEVSYIVTIVKQMFPMLTKKTIGKGFYHIGKTTLDKNIWRLLIDYPFPYFRMQSVYYVAALKVINGGLK